MRDVDVWAHVPCRLHYILGARSEPPGELKDGEEERQLDNRRNMLGRTEDQARKAGVDKVLFARPSYVVHSLRS